MKRMLRMLVWLFLAVACATAQPASPIISGGIGLVSTTNGGQTFVQPIVAPVASVPVGEHGLIEARADLRSFIFQPTGNGPYDHEFFATLEYLQYDYLMNSRATLSVGRYLTPFGIYNERLTAFWIRNIADAPIIYSLGTRTTGSSDGAMLRGELANSDNVQVNYTAYFSAGSTAEQFSSGRAAGGRLGFFVPSQRLEVGGSYQRYLEGRNLNVVGAHLSWRPHVAPLDVKGEFARSISGYGYWLEAALAPENVSSTFVNRIQPVIRMQQFVRKTLVAEDQLPSRNTQRLDVGLNAYLPHEFRVQGSYGREFAGIESRNVWNVGVSYRFLFPIIGGRAK